VVSGYSDYAANERTFLAWVRTGIAIIAFGFVIEKFNLFVLTLANVSPAGAGHQSQSKNFPGHSAPRARLNPLRLALIIIASPLCPHSADARRSEARGRQRARELFTSVAWR
jgi:putative membrane protein